MVSLYIKKRHKRKIAYSHSLLSALYQHLFFKKNNKEIGLILILNSKISGK